MSETFVAEMLGITLSEAERHMMEEALSRREIRNETAPPVWAGVDGGLKPRGTAREAVTSPRASEAACNRPRPADSHLGAYAP